MRFFDWLSARLDTPGSRGARASRRSRATKPTTLAEQAEAIRIEDVEASSVVTRPPGFEAHVETEFDELANEQVRVWTAEGQRASRADEVSAAAIRPQAYEEARLISAHAEEVDQALADYQHASRHLTPYLGRPRRDETRYKITLGVLALGDTVGVLGAAITMGEVPLIAAGQAIASGVAAVTAGLVGGQVKELRLARDRHVDLEELDPELRRYPMLFNGRQGGLAEHRLTMAVAGTIVVLLSLAVFALRWAIEGSIVGLTFGALAAATALASFISSYIHADDVADRIESYKHRYLEAAAHQKKISASSARRDLERYAASAETIQAEHESRGQAAERSIQALKHGVLRRNPTVFGHGTRTGTVIPLPRNRRHITSEPDIEAAPPAQGPAQVQSRAQGPFGGQVQAQGANSVQHDPGYNAGYDLGHDSGRDLGHDLRHGPPQRHAHQKVHGGVLDAERHQLSSSDSPGNPPF